MPFSLDASGQAVAGAHGCRRARRRRRRSGRGAGGAPARAGGGGASRVGFCPFSELLSWTVSPRLKEQDTAGKIASFVWETTSDRRCWAQPGVPRLPGGGCWHSETRRGARLPQAAGRLHRQLAARVRLPEAAAGGAAASTSAGHFMRCHRCRHLRVRLAPSIAASCLPPAPVREGAPVLPQPLRSLRATHMLHHAPASMHVVRRAGSLTTLVR